MKRLYKLIATMGMLGSAVLPATVTCNVPDVDVRFVPTDDYYYDDDGEYYHEDYYQEDYYYDDYCCEGGFDFGFDFWNW